MDDLIRRFLAGKGHKDIDIIETAINGHQLDVQFMSDKDDNGIVSINVWTMLFFVASKL